MGPCHPPIDTICCSTGIGKGVEPQGWRCLAVMAEHVSPMESQGTAHPNGASG